METDLTAQYDGRKSFYGKAVIINDNGKLILRSYETEVAYIENGKAIVKDTYSNTTLRHIKEFLKQNGFKAETSKQILKDYQYKETETQKDSHLKMVGMIANLSELYTDNQKDKNDWKARMLKAGLGNRGLEMPNDWETLTEDEKETRLNNALEVLK